ncbi:MAG: DUF1810 domain-containing protein [Paracoccaceae bacterium]
MDGLARFHEAQDIAYETALAELEDGHKQSHWMWYIFPQLRSLGRSATAKHFGLENLAEAQAYAADPKLGTRLEACARAMLSHEHGDAEAVLGPVDAVKLRSSATLFRAAADPELAALMQDILDRFYDGEPCPRTQAEIG